MRNSTVKEIHNQFKYLFSLIRIHFCKKKFLLQTISAGETLLTNVRSNMEVLHCKNALIGIN